MRLLLTLISFLVLRFSFAQTSEQAFAFANQQFKMGNTEVAAAAYHRIAFFDSTNYKAYCLHQLAEIAYNKKSYYTAIQYYQEANFTEKNDSLYKENILGEAYAYIMVTQYDFALASLDMLEDDSLIYLRKKKNILYGYCHFELGNYTESERYLLLDEDSVTRSEIKHYFSDTASLAKPKEKKAKLLSAFIPGAGQLYAGDVKNGINSFLLIGGFSYIMITSSVTYGIGNALVLVSPWLLRYYMGGIKKAGHIATIKNADNREKMKQNIFKTIQSF